MSGALVFLAWSSTIKDATKLAVLDKLCNFAGDDGENCFPGTPLLAGLARRSERTVIRTLQELEAEGWIAIEQRGNGAGNLTHYVINVEKLKGCQDVTLQPRSKRSKKGDTGDMKRVTPATKKGDTGDNPPHPLFRRTSRNQEQEHIHAAGAAPVWVCDEKPGEPAKPQSPDAGEAAIAPETAELDAQQLAHLATIPEREAGKREFWERHYRESNAERAAALARDAAQDRERAAELARARSEIPDAKAGVEHVMRRCGWTWERRSPLGDAIMAALQAREREGEPPWVSARRMADHWLLQRKTPKSELRVKYGPLRFVAEGHWIEPNGWHWANR